MQTRFQLDTPNERPEFGYEHKSAMFTELSSSSRLNSFNLWSHVFLIFFHQLNFCSIFFFIVDLQALLHRNHFVRWKFEVEFYSCTSSMIYFMYDILSFLSDYFLLKQFKLPLDLLGESVLIFSPFKYPVTGQCVFSHRIVYRLMFNRSSCSLEVGILYTQHSF